MKQSILHSFISNALTRALYWNYRWPNFFFQTWTSDCQGMSTGVLFAEIWSRKMFSDRIFRNGLFALKTSAACAIPASDMVVLVFSQISLFAERTTNQIDLLIWICCKGHFNFYNNLPKKIEKRILIKVKENSGT